jgi:hypothetical protein
MLLIFFSKNPEIHREKKNKKQTVLPGDTCKDTALLRPELDRNCQILNGV